MARLHASSEAQAHAEAGQTRAWAYSFRRWPRPRAGSPQTSLVLLGLAAAIPVILFGAWVAYITASDERASARRTAYATIDRVAERVSAELKIQLEIAKTLAASAALDQPDLGRFYEEARRINRARPLWETIELDDAEGQQMLNLLRPYGAPLGKTGDRASFEAVLRTRAAGIGGIGPIGPISGKRLVAVRAPVIRKDALVYVVSVHLVPDAVSHILRQAGVPDGWVGAIVDAKGNFVARTAAEEFEIGRPAPVEVRDAIARAPQGDYLGRSLEGVPVEVVYRTLPDTGGWSVHLGVPTDALNAPVHRSLFVLAAGGLGSLSLGAMLALLTVRDLAQRQKDKEMRANLALKVSEERGAVAVAAAELGTWCWDLEAHEIVASERCRVLLGLPPGQPAGSDWRWPERAFLDAVHPEDRPVLEEAARRGPEDPSMLDVDFRAVWPDGAVQWCRAIGRAPPSHPQPVTLVQGVVADIGPQKRAEAERLDLLRRLSEAQENEQRRIARELHDQIEQTVTGLSLGLKGLEKALDDAAPPARALEQVRWLQALANQIGRDIHRTAADLRPTALDDLGFARAVEAYAGDWSRRFGIRIDLQFLGSRERLPAELETALYRIVQEGLTNVLKHAEATSVSVLVERRSDQLRLIIEDDGRGFDPPGAEPFRPDEGGRTRLGLSGIRERLALVGGRMTIESSPGAGTTLFIHVPLRDPARAS